ncbi:trypsin-like peptidase domain-containing protein [Streptomyces sp. NPDC090108]|uniref:trypsin-like peptidase domain-containing protein n=1 Tax=Streptomyces sp. NPDC090108 TaxID=3365947 RepID=UPI0037FD1B26
MNEGNPTHVPAGERGERGDGDEREDRGAPGARSGESGASRVSGASGGHGDFELAKPVPGGRGSGSADFPEPAGPDPDAPDVDVEQFADRLRPLHDPDPYSTPPYGEPGPWAPAPPVQHPSAAQAQVQGAGVPARPPVPPPAPEVPVPVPPPAVPAPAAETSVPTQAPVPAAEVPLPAQPPAPNAEVPLPAQAPAPAVEAPVPSPEASVPAPSPTQVPAGDSVFSASAPAAVPATGSTPAPPPADGGGPGRYDPWAGGAAGQQAGVLAPLQQTGAAMTGDGQRRRRARRTLLGASLAIALVAGGIGGFAGAWLERQGLGDIHLPQAGAVPAGRAPDSVAGIAARALPSVVTLHVSGQDEAGTGTGFVLDTRGHILTNNHVVAAAASGGRITVTFSSGDTAKARVVGRDSGYDLAVVQVSGVRGLTPMPLGDSDGVQVGDPVVAIGAPFDLANTVTSGIISAKERPITAGGEKGDGSDISYVDALQTDAPINPGNSGGPLLDTRGRVIGINSAIRSADGGSDSGDGQAGSIGLGFAIPVNQARRVAEELINGGHATHPVIGVTLDMGYSGDGARIGVKGGDGGPAVVRGGPGARAGLAAGDVITAVDGERVHSGEELIVRIRAHRPGDRLRLTVEHDGTEREVPLVLGASEQN